MRMIGIGLMGFLLAGVALLLSTMNILEQGQHMVRQIAAGPQLVFEHRLAASAPGNDTAEILRSNPDHPVILAGFPAYQSVAFTFPKDARPTSGYLQINATTQVLAGVEGVLRISIHNTRRGELLLRPGEAGRSLQIPLSPSDFAGDQLVVSFSLQGTDTQQQCGPEDGIAAIVEIETTSALHLTLNEPLISARDRVHAWGDVVRVSWPAWLQQDEQLRRLLLGVDAKRHGLRTLFLAAGEEDALTTVALREVLATVSGASAPTVDDPQALAQSGVNAGVRRFHHATAWRARYSLEDGGKQRIPAYLDVRLALGDLFGDHLWSLTVTLNNRLLLQDSFKSKQREYEARIDLPADWQGAHNQIEIVATTNAERNGVCDQGPELVAEMLPETQLVPGEDVYAGPIDDLRTMLAALDPIHVSLTASLTAVQAEQVAGWLAQIAPPSATLKPAQQTAHIVIVNPGDMHPSLPESGSVWVLIQGADTGTVDLRPLQPGQGLPAKRAFLLIAPAGIEIGGVAS
ncbi:cellulose biosynthesis cyclic di-GMP-binding regulatory protein BcsB [uncultured Tateyamaria sp.]|uniref:cellulose biosynthesis cyclic di-GMP-binding regulatory protein BcsB n=1 Tax=uncultured Tateyamaria sp. TaxID=455651 RepID=UPI00260AA868|nr:cellulose biosynthesis cyclic di-GMP-binding regulatory protein BcsB [uncultured Tateyamaria sp.]